MSKFEICDTCENKNFDIKKGISCGLTGEKPAFVGTCVDYKENPEKLKNKQKSIQEDIEKRVKFLEKRVEILWLWMILVFITCALLFFINYLIYLKFSD
jgi:hypothetical protein